MSDSIVLVCAVLASLAFGVLAAYGVCLSTFGLFRLHARQFPAAAKTPRIRVASSASVLES
ncbi:MAG: hypothetical protein P4K80_02250 [Acidobacteriaceae bacterium]|nr:hypothetical protein [Acidobacteriaceae bacterium]